jgi:hypothetical protein
VSVRCLIFIKKLAVFLFILAPCSVAASSAFCEDLAVTTEPPVSSVQNQAPPPQEAPPPSDETQQPTYATLTEPQLERLVAPIALYPDSLVAQVLAASEFPSQIVDAEGWLKAHQGMTPQQLGDAANQQTWDASVKALIEFPSVLNNLSSNLGWTSELGDAYYNQPQDVMNAVQAMRQKAQSAGNLKSTQQENIQDNNGQIQIEPADPNVVYVPAYDPWLVYGYPIAPWPYWVDVPGIWWGGPGLYFGIGFPIFPFFAFGWGWHAWGLDWFHHGVYFNHSPYFARGGDFFDRRGYYGGRGDFGRGEFGRGGFRGGEARGFAPERGGGVSGLRSGPFTGINHGGGVSRGFSARGQSSMGGFHAGGFGGGGFHGGGGRR